MAERLPEPEWSGGEPKKGKWVEWGLYLQSCSLSAP
jgi:hypothetical protein